MSSRMLLTHGAASIFLSIFSLRVFHPCNGSLFQTWETTLLVVSHDRQFLDEVPTDIYHFYSQRLEPYRGNYSDFIKTMNDRLTNQQREYEAQMAHRKQTQLFIDKFRYNAKRASLVQSRIKALEKL